MKKVAIGLLTVLALGAFVPAAFGQVLLNEIRIDQPGADVDEYFELSGTPGTSLAGLTLIVIGDSGTSSTCGYIEAVLDLSPYSIQADGYLAIVDGDGVPTLSGYDVMLPAGSLNFENSDNVTFMIVRGFTGSNGQKLDTNDDGVLDITPWSSIVDCVGLDEGTVPNCTGDEYLYCSVTVGPDGNFVPGHVFRCGSQWYIGAFDPNGGADTPGSVNQACATDTHNHSWGQLKTIFR